MLRNFRVSSKSQNLEPFWGPRRNNSTNQKEAGVSVSDFLTFLLFLSLGENGYSARNAL